MKLGLPTFADATLCFNLFSMVATPIYDSRQRWFEPAYARAINFTSEESTSCTCFSSPDGAVAGAAVVAGAGGPGWEPAPLEWFSPFSESV